VRPRLLVAGIGNVFRRDDAFGVDVAQRLACTALPDGVEVMDVGIRSVHLAFQLLDGYDELVVVDAVGRGDPPGTVTVAEAAIESGETEPLDPHRLEPGPLLASVQALGALPPRVVVVGCEPAEVGDGMGLSPAVAAAIGPAVDAVRRLVDEFVTRGRRGDEEDALRAPGAGPDRLRRLPPALGHRALPADEADVSAATPMRRS
jgi:hydrogenase maturation protease